jgi:hypothetical protein
VMRKHVSLEDLALLDADALKPRKAAKVRSHLAHCAECSQQRAALGAVPNMLASASSRYEPMPENLSTRVDSALASESAKRLASEPGTEAARGALPARSRRSGILAGAGRSLRMPSLSGPTVRALATAGAAAVVVGGGIGIATQLGGASSSSSSASGSHASVRGPAAPAYGQPGLKKVAAVSYGHGQRIEEVSASTNFTARNLKTTVNAAVRAEKANGDYSSSQLLGPSGSASSPALSDRAATVGPFSPAAGNAATIAVGPSPSQLAGCLNLLVGPGQKLQLLERATFDNTPATIVVTAAPLGQAEHVWVVGNSCSSTSRDLIAQGTLPNDS